MTCTFRGVIPQFNTVSVKCDVCGSINFHGISDAQLENYKKGNSVNVGKRCCENLYCENNYMIYIEFPMNKSKITGREIREI